MFVLYIVSLKLLLQSHTIPVNNPITPIMGHHLGHNMHFTSATHHLTPFQSCNYCHVSFVLWDFDSVPTVISCSTLQLLPLGICQTKCHGVSVVFTISYMASPLGHTHMNRWHVISPIQPFFKVKWWFCAVAVWSNVDTMRINFHHE